MRTTLTLDDDLFMALDERARATGRSFKEVVNEVVRFLRVTEQLERDLN